MKVTYDARVDVLRIVFTDLPVADSDEDKPGVILDFAADGSLVSMEILDASRRVGNPTGVEYAVVGMTTA